MSCRDLLRSRLLFFFFFFLVFFFFFGLVFGFYCRLLFCRVGSDYVGIVWLRVIGTVKISGEQ